MARKKFKASKEKVDAANRAKGSVRPDVEKDLLANFVSVKMTDRKKRENRGYQKHKGKNFKT